MAAHVYDMLAYGAVGDDPTQSLADTTALRIIAAAIEASPPADTHTIQTSAPRTWFYIERYATKSFGVEFKNCHHVTFDSSLGLKIKAANWGTQAFCMFELGLHGPCTDFNFIGCSLDGDWPALIAGEQSHLLDVREVDGLNVIGVTATNVRSDVAKLTGSRRADATGYYCENILFDGCTINSTNRSFVAIQRSTRNVTIQNCTGTNVSDQYIDFEPTGPYLGPANVAIQNCNFGLVGTVSQYAIAISGLSSSGDGLVDGVTILNVNARGGIGVRDCKNVSIDSSTFDATGKTHGWLTNGFVSNLNVTNSTFIGPTGMQFGPHSTQPAPNGAVFDNCTFESLVSSYAVIVRSSSNVELNNSTFIAPISGSPTQAAVVFEAEQPGTDMDNLAVYLATWSTPWLVQLNPRLDRIDNVLVTTPVVGNILRVNGSLLQVTYSVVVPGPPGPIAASALLAGVGALIATGQGGTTIIALQRIYDQFVGWCYYKGNITDSPAMMSTSPENTGNLLPLTHQIYTRECV